MITWNDVFLINGWAVSSGWWTSKQRTFKKLVANNGVCTGFDCYYDVLKYYSNTLHAYYETLLNQAISLCKLFLRSSTIIMRMKIEHFNEKRSYLTAHWSVIKHKIKPTTTSMTINGNKINHFVIVEARSFANLIIQANNKPLVWILANNTPILPTIDRFQLLL